MRKKFVTEYIDCMDVTIGNIEQDIDLHVEIVFDTYWSDTVFYSITLSGNKTTVRDDFENETDAERFIAKELEKLFNLDSLKVRVYITDDDITVVFDDDENIVTISNEFDEPAFVYDDEIVFYPIEEYMECVG